MRTTSNMNGIIGEEASASLDVVERLRFAAGGSPFDRAARQVALLTAAQRPAMPAPPPAILLDGLWELAEEGDSAMRLSGAWPDAIPARVPGSIHAALVEAGLLPDPAFGENAAIAKAYSHKTWWYRRKFDAPGWTGLSASPALTFDGVTPGCEAWLNGVRLGDHNGAFGGPSFQGFALKEAGNELIVKVLPAPLGNEWTAWHSTVVFNCNYGWHYVDLPAVGIWRSVRIDAKPEVSIGRPFVAVTSAERAFAGRVDIAVDFACDRPVWSGTLRGEIAPDNFPGEPLAFAIRVDAAEAAGGLRLEVEVPRPRLWWPVDMGEQPLYKLALSFSPQGDGLPDRKETTFGIRSLEMGPLPGGERRDVYNWTFIVNGKPMFAKGTGWCTMDALMDFSRERYAHFLSLAAAQHVQLLRAWGGGMPETDDFYDLCDRKGLMVMQEWPTCWGSHDQQPADVLEATVRTNTVRLRNHPSLVMWAGGNEIGKGLDSPVMDMMGRLAAELDGTRPFHLTDPWGGSMHSHIVWKGWSPAYGFDYYANLDSVIIGEFGLASAPNMTSMRRFMPEDELKQWPQPPGRSFYRHLPAFDTRDDCRILTEYADAFVACDGVEAFVFGTQLAQVTSLRHKIEHARSRWPHEIGVITYKLNDVYIGMSWATVDWYGAPKMSHYFTQDAFAPTMASVLFSKLNSPSEPQKLPVFVFDDSGRLDGEWQANVRVYGPSLEPMSTDAFAGEGPVDRVKQMGYVALAGRREKEAPLLVVSELYAADGLLHRTFYWFNFDARQGALAHLPRTALQAKIRGQNQVAVKNIGRLPAVGVELYRMGDDGSDDAPDPAHLICDDNFFWLDAGETRLIVVNDTYGISVRAWNADPAAEDI
ncbi:glycoside hydrolase family 2 protein [Cohnella sp. GCM10012308]|uniref:glycoside hydrolase family 2 protein n=1 Tax=Cohnella sp. GCM10012308 TaxID=3317329 RepID=UPI0036137A98